MKLKEKLAEEQYGSERIFQTEAFLAGFERAKTLALKVCEVNEGGADFVGPGYGFYMNMEQLGEEEVE